MSFDLDRLRQRHTLVSASFVQCCQVLAIRGGGRGEGGGGGTVAQLSSYSRIPPGFEPGPPRACLVARGLLNAGPQIPQEGSQRSQHMPGPEALNLTKAAKLSQQLSHTMPNLCTEMHGAHKSPVHRTASTSSRELNPEVRPAFPAGFLQQARRFRLLKAPPAYNSKQTEWCGLS